MIGWCSWGAVNLAWMVEYTVQTGRAQTVYFELFLPLTGIRVAKSGIDGRVFGVVAIISMLVFATLGLAVVISWFRSPSLA